MTDEKKSIHDEFEVKVATALHMSNYNINEDMDGKEFGDLVNEIRKLVKEAVEKARGDIIKKLQNIEGEKWQDAKHCTCLGFAIEVLKGNVDE